MLKDFKEYRYNFWGKTIYFLVIACCLGSMMWVIKDLTISSGSRLIWSVSCRFIPCLFYFIYVRFKNKDNFIHLALIQIWLSIIGVAVLYFLDPSIKTSGIGWQMYICLLFVACITSNIYIPILNFTAFFIFLYVLYEIHPEKLTITLSEFYFSTVIIMVAMVIVIYYISKLFNETLTLNRKLEDASVKDQLTNIYTRRIINKTLINNVLDTDCTIFIMDVDKFKKINDTYGHNTGDDCLILTAKALKRTFTNDNDLIIRYGGDEFLVLCDGKINVAEKHQELLKNVEELKKDIDITFSIGTTYATSGENIHDCIKRADVALYKVKEQGRNNCMRFEDIDGGLES